MILVEEPFQSKKKYLGGILITDEMAKNNFPPNHSYKRLSYDLFQKNRFKDLGMSLCTGTTQSFFSVKCNLQCDHCERDSHLGHSTGEYLFRKVIAAFKILESQLYIYGGL